MSSKPTANTFSSATSLLAILRWAEASEHVSVARVRQDLRVSDRQARDYLAFLVRESRIRSVRCGRTDEYYLVRQGEGGIDTLQQLAGAEFAVAALNALRGTAFHDAALTLVSSLRGRLQDVQGPRAARLHSAFYAVRGSVPANPQHAQHAETVLEAIMYGRTLCASYELLRTGEVRKYVLRPLSLVVHHEGLHLLARKVGGAVRMFDVEGFRELTRSGDASPQASIPVANHFTHAFGRYTDFSPATVTMRVRDIAARQVRRRIFHTTQRIERDDGDELIVRMRVGLCPEFVGWLLAMGPNVEVIRPTALRATLQRLHREAAATNL